LLTRFNFPLATWNASTVSIAPGRDSNSRVGDPSPLFSQ
jgi:hypothetical protein